MSSPHKRLPRIYDAVYGYIELDDIEFKLINTAIFQRLHWIKQLGPLHAVFPSAQHSRFSHTIGVFYIAKKMIEHLKSLAQHESPYGYDFPHQEDRILKFAALLHDIGHVPLSHIGEHVLRDSIDLNHKLNVEQVDLLDVGANPSRKKWASIFPDQTLLCGRAKLHERLSAEIVLHDETIDSVLAQVWADGETRKQAKRRVAQTIVGMDLTDIPTVLLHSELDADRLDYLLRDSFFTGVGYGHIDLDYIISRLVIHRNEETDHGELCVEHKGLHTVEHYILGRFFLQVQVILNRKVRLMDLLFEDVMGYMLQEACPSECRLMSLQEFCKCIHKSCEKTNRADLHRIYSYTDAQVFTKMRELHDRLDHKEKCRSADEEELYINDCIKMIMDGKLPEPVFHTCQKLVSLDDADEEQFEREIREQGKSIAHKVAAKCGIPKRRIKVNLVHQNVMKYSKKEEAEQEPNLEAVKILYQTPGGKDVTKAAAKSNAALLRPLIDKSLLLFNCYYVESKNQDKNEVDGIRRATAESFKGLIGRCFHDSGADSFAAQCDP